MFKVPESESASELVMVRMGCSSCICFWLQQSLVGLQASANLLEFLFSGVSKVPHIQASENILIDGILVSKQKRRAPKIETLGSDVGLGVLCVCVTS